ncbi:MAG: short-chain fatty acyl-CoA regulator family protein [Actinomycetia bacterium]|nr:short-chain fatty acyl-CoA regulator family protein [Actinomycetes bacterium]
MLESRQSFVGSQIRRLREERHLTQAALAHLLGISPSYLNQIERNRRALTVPILLRFASIGVDVRAFSDDDTARLVGELEAIFADPSINADQEVRSHDLREMVRTLPTVARAVVLLHRRLHHVREQVQEAWLVPVLPGRPVSEDDLPHMGMPYEEVRDYFYDHRSYFPDLDVAAENMVPAEAIGGYRLDLALEQLLLRRFGVRLASSPDPTARRRYDASASVLTLSDTLPPRRRAFQIAMQLALLGEAPLLDELTISPTLSSDEARALARTGLALYFAGSVVLPYSTFLRAAEDTGYDIEALADRFSIGIETVCHRLSTLQRPNEAGVPFFFVRADRAGNVSKMHSATGIHFSRLGGSCPLWNVFEVFSFPGRVLTQVADMPDGQRSLWIATMVRHSGGGYNQPGKEFAIGLGCEIRHAHRLIYARGLDLHDGSNSVPVGPGCRLCARPDCTQRAYPRAGQPLSVDPNISTTAPYATTPTARGR